MRIFYFLFTLMISSHIKCSYAWHLTGHRIVAEIAQKNISSHTKKQLQFILGSKDLASVANWPDFVKSDKRWNFARHYHFANTEKKTSYFQSKKHEKGDIVSALYYFDHILRSKTAKLKRKQVVLKYLVHCLGDMHQPLHLGRELDWGGNKIKIKYFNQETNLHVLWDKHMIVEYSLSYSEYAKKLGKLNAKQRSLTISGDYLTWAEESKLLVKDIYNYPGKSYRYEYAYRFRGTLEKQLQRAGYRLAYALDQIFKGHNLSEKFQQNKKSILTKKRLQIYQIKYPI